MLQVFWPEGGCVAGGCLRGVVLCCVVLEVVACIDVTLSHSRDAIPCNNSLSLFDSPRLYLNQRLVSSPKTAKIDKF